MDSNTKWIERLAVVESEVKQARQDIHEVKTIVTKLSQDMPRAYVDKEDFGKLVERVDAVENRTGWKLTMSYVAGVILLITSAITLYELFTR